MRYLSRIGSWLSELRESADRALMAASLAQVGEPELAREVLRPGCGDSRRRGARRSDGANDRWGTRRCRLGFERAW